MTTAFDPDVILARPLMVMIGTVAEAGPRIAPMWFLWEEGALWMPSDTSARSVARLSEDARVAAEIVEFDAAAGRLLHLGMRGVASVEPMGAARFRRLLSKYLGPDEAAWNPWFIDRIARIDDPSGRFIRLLPDSIFTNNVSFFRSGPEILPP